MQSSTAAIIRRTIMLLDVLFYYRIAPYIWYVPSSSSAVFFFTDKGYRVLNFTILT